MLMDDRTLAAKGLIEGDAVVRQPQHCLYPASIIIQETCRDGSRAMFPKVPCDRPRFAATRGYCVPPRASRRACVLRQRTRARRVRRRGRGGRAVRCFVALTRPHVARHNHTQAGERRAREALVRAGAGFHDDRCTGEARAAGRRPFLARRGRTCRLASGWGRAGVGRGRRSSRAGRAAEATS